MRVFHSEVSIMFLFADMMWKIRLKGNARNFSVDLAADDTRRKVPDPSGAFNKCFFPRLTRGPDRALLQLMECFTPALLERRTTDDVIFIRGFIHMVAS